MALPLSQVARLEELPRSAVECLGTRQVAQYRNEILPLVDISRELDALRLGRPSIATSPGDETTEIVPVIVHGDGERRVGLIVDRILDIVHDQVAARSRAGRPGVLFTAIVQDRVTEFIDIAAVVRDVTSDLPQATGHP